MAWGWPQWWKQINYEHSARAWLFVVELAAIGYAALLTWYLRRTLSPGRPREHAWLLLAVGFVYLSLDKGFQIHENLREKFFRPRGIGTHIPGVGAGDITPIIYAALGIALVVALVRWVKFDPREARWLYLSVILAAIGVVLDVAELPHEDFMLLRRAQFTEKAVQTVSLACLLVFVLRHNADLLRELAAHRDPQRAG